MTYAKSFEDLIQALVKVLPLNGLLDEFLKRLHSARVVDGTFIHRTGPLD